jgi:acyl carrier protein
LEEKLRFASVGTPLDDVVEVRILDQSGKDCVKNIQGAIHLRGDMIFQRYHNDEVATSNCMTKDGWFNTGDLGSIDENGILRIHGRAKETLIINGVNFSTFELEHTIETANIKGLTPSFTASFSTWIEGQHTESIVVLFHPEEEIMEDSAKLKKTIEDINHAVIGFCAKPPHAVIPLPKKKLPKSALGKLSRGKLKRSFEAGEFEEYLVKDAQGNDESNGAGLPLTSALQETIADALARHTSMPKSHIKADTPFQRMKIDSLGYLRIKRSLEKWLNMEEAIPMPLLIRSSTVQELEAGLLAIGTVTVTYDPIVPLATGSKTPLILCPPAGGEFLTWLPVLKYLPDRPVYALRIKGLQKDETLFKDLEDMLE